MKVNDLNLWDELSRRCHGLNRDFIKHYMYLMSYSAPNLDPWICNILGHELSAIRREQQRS